MENPERSPRFLPFFPESIRASPLSATGDSDVDSDGSIKSVESITQVLRRKAETRLENALANGLRPRRALKDYSNQKSLYVYESTDDENSDRQEESSTKERSKRKPMPRSKRRSTRNGGRETRMGERSHQ